jgi:hypothetical protein
VAANVLDMAMWWQWIAVNSFVILLTIYLVSTVCLVVLATCVNSLSRRVSALAHNGEQQGRRIDKLTKSLDEQAIAFAALNKCAPESGVAPNPDGLPRVATVATDAIRDELKTLIADLAADNPNEAFDLDRTKT